MEKVTKVTRILFFVIFILLLVCSTVFAMSSVPPTDTKGGGEVTSEKAIYIDLVMRTPLEITVSSEEVDAVWERAGSFIEKYSSMKIIKSTDDVIQTEDPPEGEEKYGYQVTKSENDDGSYTIISKCVAGHKLDAKWAEQNSHILSDYIISGEISPKFVAK